MGVIFRLRIVFPPSFRTGSAWCKQILYSLWRNVKIWGWKRKKLIRISGLRMSSENQISFKSHCVIYMAPPERIACRMNQWIFHDSTLFWEIRSPIVDTKVKRVRSPERNIIIPISAKSIPAITNDPWTASLARDEISIIVVYFFLCFLIDIMPAWFELKTLLFLQIVHDEKQVISPSHKEDITC